MFFQFLGPFERAKYYAIWSLTEVSRLARISSYLILNLRWKGASILTGLGFTDIVNGKPQWNGAANVKIWQIEFASNFKVLLDAWNMKTNVWLRECVYKRVTPKGKKPGNASSMITFMTSALWVSRTFDNEHNKWLTISFSTESPVVTISPSF